MGDLRNFIRSQEQKIKGKLGKEVKCFNLVEEVNLDKLMQEYKDNKNSSTMVHEWLWHDESHYQCSY